MPTNTALVWEVKVKEQVMFSGKGDFFIHIFIKGLPCNPPSTLTMHWLPVAHPAYTL